ncbi:MAG: SWIM zinc finger family protein [Deltaproteobacteria bacterium]
MAWYGRFGGWKPYVPVAQRRAQSSRYAAQVAKREKRELAPVTIAGQKIARSFWGKAWCDNLERYSDYSNRLPRGRTYVRNGSVIDLQIAAGEIKALVSGSSVYKVSVSIRTLEKKAWKRIKHDCSQSIDSLIDLLQGRFDQGIMQRLTERDDGLFPRPAEIKMSCSCPDWAGLCKHVAAVLYGVGARLDTSPELLFTLRAVDHLELISQAVAADNLDRTLAGRQDGALAGSDLGELFGIEIDAGDGELSTRSQDNGPLEAPAGKRRPGCKRAAPSTVDVKVDPRVPLKPGSGCTRAARKKPAAKKPATKKRAAKSRAATPARALATRRKTP